MGKTWEAFWAASALLLNPRVRASRRVAVFHSCVTPVHLWALAGLARTTSMIKHADNSTASHGRSYHAKTKESL